MLRRSAVQFGMGLLAVALVLPSCAWAARPAPAPGAPAHARSAPRAQDQSLRALASRADLLVGTAVNKDWLSFEAQYRGWIGSEFSSVTPETVMKWRTVEPARGRLDFSAADQLVAFAQAHGQRVRGHTLVWDEELPGWLTSGSFTPDELRQILRRHVIDEVSHFRGRVAQWDVVNQALNDDGTALRDTIWLRGLGPGYVADAFRWAHEADPDAQLFYNDFGTEPLGTKSDAVLALVRQLLAQGVPVAGVGFQAHQTLDTPAPLTFQRSLQRFSDLGLLTEITEADVRVPLPVDAAKLDAQASRYALLFDACLHTPRCGGVTVWGFTDRHSWLSGPLYTGYGAADLLDERYQPKPAYWQVRAAVGAATGAGGDPFVRTYPAP